MSKPKLTYDQRQLATIATLIARSIKYLLQSRGYAPQSKFCADVVGVFLIHFNKGSFADGEKFEYQILDDLAKMFAVNGCEVPDGETLMRCLVEFSTCMELVFDKK